MMPNKSLLLDGNLDNGIKSKIWRIPQEQYLKVSQFEEELA
jgi:hypothetical protein